EFESASQLLHQALTLYQAIKDRRDEGVAALMLAATYGDWGDNTTAIVFYQQVLTVAREIADRSLERGALSGLGLCYQTLGDYAKAITYYQQSLDLARELSDREGEVLVLRQLGNTYYKQGNDEKGTDDALEDSILMGESLNPDEGGTSSSEAWQRI